MPPEVIFTRERILRQTFEIVRKEGLEALSTRKIAQHLNCSTRPIYSMFRSMEELREAVIKKAREYALSYFLQEVEEADSPFLNLGLRYFRFAQEEKKLFKLLYVDGNMGNSIEQMGKPFLPLLVRMKQDPHLRGLSKTVLKRIGANLWIYTHGLISLSYDAPPPKTEEFVRKHLREVGKALIEWEHHRKQRAE